MLKYALVIAAAFAGTQATAASLFQLDASFTITSTFGDFPAPKTFELAYVYDTALGFSETPNLVSSRVTVDGMTYTGTGTGYVSFRDQVPTSPPTDRFDAFDTFSFALGSVTIETVGLNLEGPETVFDAAGGHVIAELADYTILDRGSVTFVDAGGGRKNVGNFDELITFSVTALAPVPVPAGLPLAASGLALMAALRLRRRTPA